MSASLGLRWARFCFRNFCLPSLHVAELVANRVTGPLDLETKKRLACSVQIASVLGHSGASGKQTARLIWLSRI